MAKAVGADVAEDVWHDLKLVHHLCTIYDTTDPLIINDQVNIYYSLEPSFHAEDLDVMISCCGLDELLARALLAQANGDLTAALNLATKKNLVARAEAGEFGEPTVAVAEVKSMHAQDLLRAKTLILGQDDNDTQDEILILSDDEVPMTAETNETRSTAQAALRHEDGGVETNGTLSMVETSINGVHGTGGDDPTSSVEEPAEARSCYPSVHKLLMCHVIYVRIQYINIGEVLLNSCMQVLHQGGRHLREFSEDPWT